MMGPLRELPGRDRARAWFAAVGAPVAWGLHLTIVYWYAEGACQNQTAVSSIEPVTLVATGLLGLVAALAGAAGWWTWRGASQGRLFDPRNRLALFGAAGALGGVVFTFAIVLEGVQVVTLGCLPG